MWGPKSSSCQMYNVTPETLPGYLAGELQPGQHAPTPPGLPPGAPGPCLTCIPCQNISGWTYDQRLAAIFASQKCI